MCICGVYTRDKQLLKQTVHTTYYTLYTAVQQFDFIFYPHEIFS